jgi:hypothetical protein
VEKKKGERREEYERVDWGDEGRAVRAERGRGSVVKKRRKRGVGR